MIFKRGKKIKNRQDTGASVFDPATFIIISILSCLGAIIGIQIITTIGISANTSIIGALIAILASRIPISSFEKFKDIQRQNLIQTAISSATFASANSLIVAIGVPWLLNMPDLVLPMLVGAIIATFIDGTLLYGIFNTKPYPAQAPWPIGVATAETLLAGVQGGKKLVLLATGLFSGAFGSFLGIPMASAGIALIGNMVALSMFAIGLLIRGYSESNLIPYNITDLYIPHGFMIGSGLIALLQVLFIIFTSKNKISKSNLKLENSSKIKKVLTKGIVMYFFTALLLAMSTKIFVTMSLSMLIGFLVFAAFAAIIQEMIVGMAAMHSGWFPATAVALISLVVGMLIGFPPAALGILVGFCVATGPAFADLGFDLKTGYIIRGEGSNYENERRGRKQQYFAAMIGFFFALIVVYLVHDIYFEAGKFVPASRLYAATINAGSSPEITKQLLIWSIPGAIIQLLGGPKRQIGILLSTGLMIHYPIAGWTVLVTLAIRFVMERFFKITLQQTSSFAGGLIAGDALFAAGKVFLPMLKTKFVAFFIK